MWNLSTTAILATLAATLAGCATGKIDMNATVYDFTVKTANERNVPLKHYEGKVLLIVNTASKCGFTPQYAGLQELYEKFKDKGFEVLAFPCNQFAGQEPGDDASIQKFCQLNYGVEFPVFAKIAVNGKDTAPLFAYLKKAAPGFLTNSIKWNFTKFLIDRKGRPTARFAPTTPPAKLEKAIAKLLEKPLVE